MVIFSKTIDNTYQDILKRHRIFILYSMAFKYILISIIDRFATNTSPHAALLFEHGNLLLTLAKFSFRPLFSCSLDLFIL